MTLLGTISRFVNHKIIGLQLLDLTGKVEQNFYSNERSLYIVKRIPIINVANYRGGIFKRDIVYCVSGGTIDISAQQVLRDGYIKQLMTPSGGGWGSNVINANFDELMITVFGNDFIQVRF